MNFQTEFVEVNFYLMKQSLRLRKGFFQTKSESDNEWVFQLENGS